MITKKSSKNRCASALVPNGEKVLPNREKEICKKVFNGMRC
jgi:hypothetical protein